jgi:hypothetical protein
LIGLGKRLYILYFGNVSLPPPTPQNIKQFGKCVLKFLTKGKIRILGVGKRVLGRKEKIPYLINFNLVIVSFSFSPKFHSFYLPPLPPTPSSFHMPKKSNKVLFGKRNKLAYSL